MDFRYQILALVIYALFIMRLTRMINADTIFDSLRIKLDDRERQELIAQHQARAAGQDVAAQRAAKRRARWHAVNYLVSCPWCVSIWLAVPTAPLLFWWVGLPIGFGVMYGFAVSHLVGLQSRWAVTEQLSVEDSDQ